MHVTSQGPEKEEATDLIHLPITATKTQLRKEGGWEQLTGEGLGAQHPPPLLQLCKEWKKHGKKSQSIMFIEGN